MDEIRNPFFIVNFFESSIKYKQNTEYALYKTIILYHENPFLLVKVSYVFNYCNKITTVSFTDS